MAVLPAAILFYAVSLTILINCFTCCLFNESTNSTITSESVPNGEFVAPSFSISAWPFISAAKRRLPSKSVGRWLFILLLLCSMDVEINPGPDIAACPPGHLSIYSANCNSLLSKLHELRAVVETNNVDVFLLQETKLDASVTDGELRIPGYSLIRRDRNRSGGGLAVYAKAALNPTKLYCPPGIEILPVKLSCKRNTLTVCSVYKPPQQNRNTFAEDLCEFVASLGQLSSRTVLAGDFNVCALVQQEYACLQPLSSTFGLRQHISEATHDRRCIDLLFTGSQLNVSAHGLAAPIEKKHAITWCFVRAVKLNLRPSAQHTVFQWDKVSWPTLRRSLAEADLLGAVLCANDTNAAWTVWSS
ncbi:MAG: hypothetical protein GY942_08345, partial [Aestuariibacter sp.]|nr:hypothetical protein [Aestuariibacter sp.]